MTKKLPSAQALRQLLDYDPQTGLLSWRERTEEWISHARIRKIWNARYAGGPALNMVNGEGYRAGMILRVGCLAHRVVWALYYGHWPDGDLDHINGNRTDNRISNLRVVDSVQNGRNMKRSKKNRSGVTGVFRDKGKWRAGITVNAKRIHLGYFDDLATAAAARKRAEADFGFHENHGRVA